MDPLDERAELRRTIGSLRDEIVSLKGEPERVNVKPDLEPSGAERASESKLGDGAGQRRRPGATRAKLTVNEEHKLEADASPGSRFKGYSSFLVQDLTFRPHVSDFVRECWRIPNGKTLTAPLPPGAGAMRRRFALSQTNNIFQ